MVAKSDWVSGDKFSAADANAVVAEMNEKVPWQGGTAGVLPATSGQKLKTQGGNTLDDGAGNVTIKGGTLDGVTIGNTYPTPSIRSNKLWTNTAFTWTPYSNPAWISGGGSYQGSLSQGKGASMNNLTYIDKIVGSTGYITGLVVSGHIYEPAIGLRNAIAGILTISSVGDVTYTESSYVGVRGSVITDVGLGGSPGAPIGAFWGGWFTATTTGGTNHANMFGVEIDIGVASDIQLKVGLRVSTLQSDTTQGSTDDVAIQVIKGGATNPGWSHGILFGSDQVPPNFNTQNPAMTSAIWPFTSDSTIIGTSNPGNGLPANIGIDFSKVTFTGPAIKLPGASIAMAPMATAPAAVAGEGMLYIATDGSLHYRGPTTDTQVAPA